MNMRINDFIILLFLLVTLVLSHIYVFFYVAISLYSGTISLFIKYVFISSKFLPLI